MLLIRDADYMVTLDGRRRILKGHSLLIKDRAIAEIGPAPELDRKHLAACQRVGSIIEAKGRLVLPGYINTHVHTFEHLSRGLIPDGLSTYDWAVRYARPFYASLSEEEAYISAKMACLDMLRNGTTCFVDTNILVSLGHFDAVVQAVDEFGMRAVLGRGVFDKMPHDMAEAMPPALKDRVLSPTPEAALREVESLLNRWTSRAGGRIRAWASIYGLFTFCSDDLFPSIRRIADKYGLGAAYHMASSLEEAHAVEARVGTWPIEHLDKLGALGPNVLLTHCTAVKDHEVALLAKRGTKVAYCPGAALRLAKGTTRIGKIPEMLQAGVVVSLGADGVSSSGSFDQLRLAYLVAGLFKDARMDPGLVPAETALEMAILGGAQAILWDDEIGSIEVGKKADLVLYDVEQPEWVPRHDIIRNLIYCADGRSVRSVLIDGNIVYQDGTPVGVDVEKLLQQAAEIGNRIVRRSGLNPHSRWPAVER